MKKENTPVHMDKINLSEIKKISENGGTPGFSLALITPNDTIKLSSGRFAGETSKEVTGNTIYDLASVTKLYTTAIILRLHESKALTIDDQCSRYLQNFSRSKIKLFDLLTHRVDFGVTLSSVRQNSYNFWEALSILKVPAESSPNINYANLGFIYLGKIIETIEGESLDKTMRKFIHELGLQQTLTGVEIKEKGVKTPPTEVVNESVIEGETHDESARLFGGLAGNAGIFATACDLALFGRAWLDGKIAPRNLLDELVFKDYDRSGNHSQALGWWKKDKTYYHPGYTGSLLAINPETHKACGFTCNRTYYGRDNTNHKKIWDQITSWIEKN